MADPSSYSRWRPHPWHGLEPGPNAPRIVNAYIEITPFDLMKYEVDKASGYLRVDRPQRTSSQPPSLYGFIPQTYCGERVRLLAEGCERGDGDPLDICVISERPINHSEVLPAALLERIEHYFSTYKLGPDEPPKIQVAGRYGFAAAAAVIRAAIEDYAEMFGRMG